MANWVPAALIRGLVDPPPNYPVAQPALAAITGNAAPDAAAQALAATRRHAVSFLRDLRSIDVRSEVVPLDQATAQTMVKDAVFWSALILGVVPLAIGTLRQAEHQLVVFAAFFAVLWGVAFKQIIARQGGNWRLMAASMSAGGLVGPFLTAWVYGHVLASLPGQRGSLKLADPGLFGFIFEVGLVEELVKALPVVAYFVWKKRVADPITGMLVGVFSGLGFAACENIYYGELSVVTSVEMSRRFGEVGLAAGVQQAMVVVLLRSISLVFCHALWSGVVAYFIALAWLTRQRVVALFVVGVLAAGVLHGVYDWLLAIQPTLAVLMVAFSYLLFYAYMSKLKTLSSPSAEVAISESASAPGAAVAVREVVEPGK